jgi:hypothetical protein
VVRRGINPARAAFDAQISIGGFPMKNIFAAAAFSALATAGLAGAAHAECLWAGNHWNCGDRFIYPKTYPWSTAIVNGVYQRPMSPPDSDVHGPLTPSMPAQQ